MAVIPVTNSGGARRTFVSTTASNIVTNTTTETAFDTLLTVPAQSTYTIQPGTLGRLKVWGTISSALLNFNLNIRLRWGGAGGTVLCTTGVFGVGASLSDNGWFGEATLILLATGSAASIEAHGYLQIQSGLLTTSPVHMPNTAAISVSTLTAADLVLTAQWSTASASNQMQIRSFVLDLDNP